ncbi:MAG TPA: LysR substrate-binding domain-containing protein [Bordetella sp.]|jgi:LysR family pca operon transcriptional activator|nr:LysR substrate-binding domain-containing protein [Bordetella sp.]
MDIEPLTASGRVNLRHLQCFVAIAQTGSLLRAAERLSISQPATSKRLVELESIVGATLFTRGRQGAQLTREGQRLLPFATRMLATLREGLHAVATPVDPQHAAVRFGVLPTLAAILVPLAFAGMRDAWSDVRLEVVTASNSELLAGVRAGQLAFAVNRAADPELSEGLRFEYLFADPLVVVTRPGHPVARAGLRESAVSGAFPVLLPPTGTLIRQSADRLLDQAGVDAPRLSLETLSMSMSRAMTLEHDAIWLVPRSAVARDIASNSLAVVPVAIPGSEERVGITTRRDTVLTAASQSMMANLREAAAARKY